MTAIEKIEKYILDYVSFEDNRLALLLALWTMAAGIFENFDAFPYIVITSNTKRSGKTRTSELLGFLCKYTENLSGLTVATLFRMIDSENKPTLIADESEFLSGESASPIRAVLNVGYRKGQTVPRVEKGTDEVKHYPTYCPKIFVLIGDVYDTLRDRSIVITMRRGEAQKRFRYDDAQNEGLNLRIEAEALVKENVEKITEAYRKINPDFLSDRDAEIWSPVFALAEVLLPPARILDITSLAADLCAMKTAERKRYSTLDMFENEAQNDEYAKRLLLDVQKVFVRPDDESNGRDVFIDKKLFTSQVVDRLREMPVAPWRKFRGDGINPNMLAEMLSRFGVRPTLVRIGKNTARGYTYENVNKAVTSL